MFCLVFACLLVVLAKPAAGTPATGYATSHAAHGRVPATGLLLATGARPSTLSINPVACSDPSTLPGVGSKGWRV